MPGKTRRRFLIRQKQKRKKKIKQRAKEKVFLYDGKDLVFSVKVLKKAPPKTLEKIKKALVKRVPELVSEGYLYDLMELYSIPELIKILEKEGAYERDITERLKTGKIKQKYKF
ncbi:MAG: hypothetical protein AB1467_01260 [Candidatus Diapherotrites archaeon]